MIFYRATWRHVVQHHEVFGHVDLDISWFIQDLLFHMSLLLLEPLRRQRQQISTNLNRLSLPLDSLDVFDLQRR